MSCSHLSQIRAPVATDMVYKAECTQCFDSNTDDFGVNVCLTCFNGGCESHSASHYRVSKHCVVVNVKLVEKPQQPEEKKPSESVTKLALNAENGFDIGQTKVQYETFTEVRCLECGIIGDQTQEHLGMIVAAVLSAKDGSEAEDNDDPWKFQPTPCDHTNNLSQHDNVPQISDSKSLAKCNDCDIQDGLWLCLTCGNLGCGRNNHDGTGGNEHGINHNKQTGHPVVLKVGTVTPDGDASVFCYSCDDDKKDIKLSEHLKVFGLELSAQKKWSLSIEEINVAANKDATRWSRIMEKGIPSTLAFGPGYCGLSNLGNSCYLASVVQVLMSLPTFQEKYYKQGKVHLNECRNSRPANCFNCQFAKLACGLLSGKYSPIPSQEVLNILQSTSSISENDHDNMEVKKLASNVQRGIAPKMFKKLIAKNHTYFKGGKQQDALEYFQYVCDEIEKEEKKTSSSSSSIKDPTSCFKFHMDDRLQCSECKQVRYKTQINSDISVDIPRILKMDTSSDDNNNNNNNDAENNIKTEDEESKYANVSFQTLINDFQKSSELEYKCPTCNKMVIANQTMRFRTFPKILTVQLKRFVYESLMEQWKPTKLGVLIDDLDQVYDFDTLRSTGLQDSEVEFPKDSSSSKSITFDPVAMSQLQGMGFSDNACKRALSQHSDIEQATNWLFGHLDDVDINDPLPEKQPSNNNNTSNDINVNEDAIAMLAAMEFPRDRAIAALKANNNNVELAVNWLFNNVGVDIAPTNDNKSSNNEDTVCIIDKESAKYKLIGVITHMGNSTEKGHYVAHVIKDNKWIYYNDAKVAIQEDPPINKGYLYFFERQ